MTARRGTDDDTGDGTLDGGARSLFDAGNDEVVPAEGKARALNALGLGGGGPPPEPGPAKGGANGSGGGSGGLLMKVAGAALVSGAVLYWAASGPTPPVDESKAAPTSTSNMTGRSPEGTEERHVDGSARTLATSTSTSTSTSTPTSTSTSTPTPTPPPTSTPTGSVGVLATSAPKAAAPKPADDNLAGELGALDQARRSVRAGQPNEALALLDGYAKTFPAGALRSEALVLRVEALMKAGREDDAKRASASFLRDHTDDGASRRIRALLSQGK